MGLSDSSVWVCVNVYLYLWQKLLLMDILQASVDSAIMWLGPLVSQKNHKAPQSEVCVPRESTFLTSADCLVLLMSLGTIVCVSLSPRSSVKHAGILQIA